jgi:hypothetical protein
MLRELSKALEDDSMQDFTAAENASNTARVRTVNVLNDLFLRMQESASRNRSLPPGSANSCIQLGAIDAPPPRRQIEPSQAPRRVYTLPDDDGSETLQRSYQTRLAPVQRQKRDSDSLDYIPGIKGLFPRRAKSSDKSSAIGQDSRRVETGVHLAAKPVLQYLRPSQQGQYTSGMLSSISLSDNPWASSTDRPIATSPTDVDTLQIRNPNLVQNHHQSSLSSVSTKALTPQDSRGFCKGAYYLQVGLKSDGMKLRNQSCSFTGENRYFACSNSRCCFEAPAYQAGKIWDLVNTPIGPRHGVKFRWSFLAKSHIEQSNAKSRNYRYRCIFCALQNSKAPVLEDVNVLIEHVARHRREELPTEGRVLVDGDDFDIHFVADNAPVDAGSLRSRLSISTIQEGGSLWSMSDDGNPWE